MAFALLKYLLIGSVILMGVALIVNLILVQTTQAEFWIVEPIKAYFTLIGSAIMLLIGYLFRGISE